MPTDANPGLSLVDKFRKGEISRRSFSRAALAMGIAPALITAVSTRVAAQDATPADGEDVFANDGSPFSEGTEN